MKTYMPETVTSYLPSPWRMTPMFFLWPCEDLKDWITNCIHTYISNTYPFKRSVFHSFNTKIFYFRSLCLYLPGTGRASGTDTLLVQLNLFLSYTSDGDCICQKLWLKIRSYICIKGKAYPWCNLQGALSPSPKREVDQGVQYLL